MLSSISPMMLAQSANPMMTTCGAVRSTFRDNSCCTATLGNSIPVPSACPTLDELVTFPKQMGNWTPCPIEEYYMTYSASNPMAPGYVGCVSEAGAKPCGWTDYYTYNPSARTCTTIGSMQTALHTVRGGSPTMTADMLRLTNTETLPTITFPAIPMAYPSAGSNPNNEESKELELTTKAFMTFYGSQMDFTNMNFYLTYGTENGMVATVAIKLLEIARTTCNRALPVLLEAPAYGYDWGASVMWADIRRTSFYNGNECPCRNETGGCQRAGQLSLTQVGWSPTQFDAGIAPMRADAFGVMHTPNSTSPNSPWFQTNVIPGNPIGRFQECRTPRNRCLCDGVYYLPNFVAPGTALRNFQCYSFAHSVTKFYSAQVRAGFMFVMDYTAAAAASSQIMGSMRALGNAAASYMQLHGQIQLMKKMMELPMSNPSSWLNALSRTQYAKWDALDAAITVCNTNRILLRTPEQQKYFGAYVFGYMHPSLQGYSINIGASSTDFFKSVVNYDVFDYSWGWRGEVPTNYGYSTIMPNVTVNDFFRINLFRAEAVYLELARRLTLVCTDKTAKVTATALSVNQWITLRTPVSGRRALQAPGTAPEEAPGLHERALKIIEVTKRHGEEMSLVDAIKHAMMTDPNQPTKWEVGMPVEMRND